MNIMQALVESLIATLSDVLPIAVIIIVFQFLVLRRRISNLGTVAWGFAFVIAGLACFLVGLELALFPLGAEMAEQLTASHSSRVDLGSVIPWYQYHWTYLFAFAIGMSTTIAEPALIAVAIKAQEVSGGSIQATGLRLAVALGVGIGVALGTFRIVTGIPLQYFILTGYLLVVIQTFFAPKQIVPLAYDAGGVTTSTVTVPLVAALGLGLASHVPNRNPLIDGFGLIAFASLFPMITVMAYAQIARWRNRRKNAEPVRSTPIPKVRS